MTYEPDSRLPIGIELVGAYVTVPKRGIMFAEVQCPFCGDRPLHGAGTPEQPVFGPRAPHCLTGSPRDYWIVGGGLQVRPLALSFRERTKRLIEDDVARGDRRSVRRSNLKTLKNR